VGRHEAAQKQLQVLYLGSSAALGTLRRAMEAHGMVTRTRITPALDVVIADPSIATDHPTMRAADSLGIPVLRTAEAIEQFAGWIVRPEQVRPPPKPPRSSWSFRPGAR
jgi:UDP-N-acetylmuramoylalanine-D-glutamate ligase